MHTYIRSKIDNVWIVGYYRDEPYRWVAFEDFTEEEDARRLVNYLNGGTGDPFPYKKD